MQPKPPPATHSPLPWRLLPHHDRMDYPQIAAADDRGIVCRINHHRSNAAEEADGMANAALIVSACNAHAADKARIAKLEEALRSFPTLPFIEDMTPDQMADKLREISNWQSSDASSALAAAGEARA